MSCECLLILPPTASTFRIQESRKYAYDKCQNLTDAQMHNGSKNFDRGFVLGNSWIEVSHDGADEVSGLWNNEKWLGFTLISISYKKGAP